MDLERCALNAAVLTVLIFNKFSQSRCVSLPSFLLPSITSPFGESLDASSNVTCLLLRKSVQRECLTVLAKAVLSCKEANCPRRDCSTDGLPRSKWFAGADSG